MNLLEKSIADVVIRLVEESRPAVAVACSGGGDSMALAHAACSLSRRGLLGPVVLMHVDHGLRPNSALDAKRVVAFGEALKLPVESLSVTVDIQQASLENAARNARYRALERCADARGIHWILLAHTSTDQAETLLMRIIRGCGLVGLAAMSQRRGRFLRPLLGVPRSAIEDYLQQCDLHPIADPMNEDCKYFRVRVRQQLVPWMTRENPRIEEALCRIADLVAAQKDVIAFSADQLLATARMEEGWSVEVLRNAPPALGKVALQRMVATCDMGQQGRDDQVRADHLDSMWHLVCAATEGSKSIDLPGKKRFVRVYDQVFCRSCRGSEPGLPVSAVEVRGPKGPYMVRMWQPGDRMCPTRLHGRSRKLRRFVHRCQNPPGRARRGFGSSSCI